MPPPTAQPGRLLIEKCRHLATFDDSGRELTHADILIEGPRIAAIGPDLRLSMGLPADIPFIDASHHLVLPGLVNCHHHLYQVLSRVVGRVQNTELFDWLVEQYQMWQFIDAEAVHLAALVAMSELLLTGATTTTDHHYLFPVNAPVELIDEEIKAARTLGMRFHPTRGSMTLGVDDDGLPPMSLVEAPERVLADYDRVITKYHDNSDFSMLRIALAPCAPFNAKEELFAETAKIARHHRIRMHTHLAETHDEDVYCLEHFGCRPLEYVARLGWEGPDVWFAHCVKLTPEDIRRCAETGTGVAHCPSSNARLGSGVAPISEMLRAGVTVGIGVDGSASNDSGNMLGEVRNSMLFQRSAFGVGSLDARAALRMATRGGAAILGNDKIGRIDVGCAADVILIDLDQYQFAGGASTDPLAGAVFCGTSFHVDYSIINGRIVVERGKICGQAEKTLVKKVNDITAALIDKVNTLRRMDYTVVVDWPKKG